MMEEYKYRLVRCIRFRRCKLFLQPFHRIGIIAAPLSRSLSGFRIQLSASRAECNKMISVNNLMVIGLVTGRLSKIIRAVVLVVSHTCD